MREPMYAVADGTSKSDLLLAGTLVLLRWSWARWRYRHGREAAQLQEVRLTIPSRTQRHHRPCLNHLHNPPCIMQPIYLPKANLIPHRILVTKGYLIYLQFQETALTPKEMIHSPSNSSWNHTTCTAEVLVQSTTTGPNTEHCTCGWKMTFDGTYPTFWEGKETKN